MIVNRTGISVPEVAKLDVAMCPPHERLYGQRPERSEREQRRTSQQGQPKTEEFRGESQGIYRSVLGKKI